MQKNSVLFTLKTIAWFLTVICLIAFIASSAVIFLYLSGFAGLMGLIVIPVFATVLAGLSIVTIIAASKQKNNIGIILLGIVILLNIFALLYSVELFIEGFTEKNKHDSYIISTENPTFDNCLSLPYPQIMHTCGNGMITKHDDLLSCLQLSKESYLRYPEYFEYPGFDCIINDQNTYLGTLKYNSTLLDKPDKLAQVFDIFDKRGTYYYKERDTNILDNATSYQDCLLIMNSENAKYCAQKILNITKDYQGCIKLSYDHGQQTAELKETEPNYFECKLGGLAFNGSLYNQGVDFEEEIQAQITINSQGIYLSEQDAMADMAYKYCNPQKVNQININSDAVNNDIKEAMKILNVNILYQSCADEETYSNAHDIDQAYKDIAEYNLYYTELQANNIAESNLRCDYESHIVNIVDTKLNKDLIDKLLELNILHAFRPCNSEEEYNELNSLSNLDWSFNSQNNVTLKSSSNTILIDNFSIDPLVSPTFISLSSKDFNYQGYDYSVQVVFDNPDKIEVGRSSELNFESNKHPISLKKQKENTTGTINYCEVSKEPESWFVNVIEIEKKIGGLLSVEFEANANCDGELFKLTGLYKTRLPLEYKNLYLK